MTPPAFLALWNGVLPERAAEYETWHAMEHMPERLGAPGFRAAKRYRAEEGAEYFTLYELDGLEALSTADYAALMDAPTAWSASMRPAFTGFSRLPCPSFQARRFGDGGAMASLRVPGAIDSVWPRVSGLIEEYWARGLLTGFLAGGTSGNEGGYRVFPNAPAPRQECLIMLEGTEPGRVAALASPLADLLEGTAQVGLWRLLQRLERAGLRAPEAARQAPREDLRRLWAKDG
ncbi:hypothetical protein IAI18_20325 [Acetobacteraceae bacterium H6797]|nr:hypothetical protein [Acetobacteraceae bacterium H6797]